MRKIYILTIEIMIKLSIQENIVHGQFIEYGRNAKEWLRKCALLLPEIEKHRIWEKRGFSSISEYAAKLAGMSRLSVDEALRVLVMQRTSLKF